MVQAACGFCRCLQRLSRSTVLLEHGQCSNTTAILYWSQEHPELTWRQKMLLEFRAERKVLAHGMQRFVDLLASTSEL
jgi:hypothetical protein